MSDIAIRVENLSKAYRIGLNEQRHETLLGAMASFVRSPWQNYRNLRKLSNFDDVSADAGNQKSEIRNQKSTNRTSDAPFQLSAFIPNPSQPPPQPSAFSPQPSDIIWALKDVSFEVKQGEVLGIIGRNGAGKSTLLKILSRITEPTSGRAEVYGRVGSLLEVGTGFHPDLTGRENIYLNGTILGMKKREIDRRFDEIVDFSGVEKFIDTPVKRYSSGMRMRLAFSVAAHLEPETLIIDEVLAVGDAEFQQKCLGKMQEVSDNGRTVLFVSHNMVAIERLCSRAFMIERGQAMVFPSVRDAIDRYEMTAGFVRPAGENVARYHSNGLVEITECQAHGAPGSENQLPGPFEDLLFTAKLRILHDVSRPAYGIEVRDEAGMRLLCVNSIETGTPMPTLHPGTSRIEVRIKDNRFMPGNYSANFWVMSPPNIIHAKMEQMPFGIRQKPIYGTRSLDSRFGCMAAVVEFAQQ